MKKLILLVCAVIAAVTALLFYARNRQMIQVDLFFAVQELPVSLWLLIAFSLGMLLGALLLMPSVLGLKWHVSRLNHTSFSKTENPGVKKALLKDGLR